VRFYGHEGFDEEERIGWWRAVDDAPYFLINHTERFEVDQNRCLMLRATEWLIFWWLACLCAWTRGPIFLIVDLITATEKLVCKPADLLSHPLALTS
jgi:hypothetical protein